MVGPLCDGPLVFGAASGPSEGDQTPPKVELWGTP